MLKDDLWSVCSDHLHNGSHARLRGGDFQRWSLLIQSIDMISHQFGRVAVADNDLHIQVDDGRLIWFAACSIRGL